MKKLFSIILFLLTLWVLGACSGINLEQRLWQSYDNSSQRDKIYSQASAVCESPTQCHPSVGYIIMKLGEDTLAACTGWVGGSQQIFTNAHCMEGFKGTSCNGKIKIMFPKANGYEPVEYECASIVGGYQATSNSHVEDVDIAFMQMKTPLLRPPVEIKKMAVAENERLFIPKFNPTAKAIHRGVFQKANCQAMESQHHEDPQSLFRINLTSDCPIIKGNSGAPILDAYGFGRGILWGYVTSRSSGQRTMGKGTSLMCLTSNIPGLILGKVPNSEMCQY